MPHYVRGWFILALCANGFGIARAGVTFSTKEGTAAKPTWTWTVVAPDDTKIHSLEIDGPTDSVIKGIDPKKDITEPTDWEFKGNASTGHYIWQRTANDNAAGTFIFSITFPADALDTKTGSVPATTLKYDTTDGTTDTYHDVPAPRTPADDNYIFTPLAAVPEPSPLVLMTVGLGGSLLVSFVGRRKARS